MKDREWEFNHYGVYEVDGKIVVVNIDEQLKGRRFFNRAVFGVDLEDGPSRSNPWTSLDIDTEGGE